MEFFEEISRAKSIFVYQNANYGFFFGRVAKKIGSQSRHAWIQLTYPRY